MRIYKEVLIESAEQADALPDGTVITREGHFAFQKYAGQFVSADPHDLPTGAAWEVIGWTALTPVEAEVEQRTVLAGSNAPFTELNGSLDDDRLRDKEGNDITEAYQKWVQTLPVEKRIVTEWQ